MPPQVAFERVRLPPAGLACPPDSALRSKPCSRATVATRTNVLYLAARTPNPAAVCLSYCSFAGVLDRLAAHGNPLLTAKPRTQAPRPECGDQVRTQRPEPLDGRQARCAPRPRRIECLPLCRPCLSVHPDCRRFPSFFRFRPIRLLFL